MIQKILLLFSPETVGLMVYTLTCRASARGSIPREGDFMPFHFFLLFLPILGDFKTPKKGLLYQAIPTGPCAFILND